MPDSGAPAEIVPAVSGGARPLPVVVAGRDELGCVARMTPSTAGPAVKEHYLYVRQVYRRWFSAAGDPRSDDSRALAPRSARGAYVRRHAGDDPRGDRPSGPPTHVRPADLLGPAAGARMPVELALARADGDEGPSPTSPPSGRARSPADGPRQWPRSPGRTPPWYTRRTIGTSCGRACTPTCRRSSSGCAPMHRSPCRCGSQLRPLSGCSLTPGHWPTLRAFPRRGGTVRDHRRRVFVRAVQEPARDGDGVQSRTGATGSGPSTRRASPRSSRRSPTTASSPTIQTAPLAFRPHVVARRRRALHQPAHRRRRPPRRAVAHATGTVVRLGIEPEPFCQLEMTDETIRYLEGNCSARQPRWSWRVLPASTRPKRQPCCATVSASSSTRHQAVEFEDIGASLDALVAAGIPIVKLQAAAVIRVPIVTGEIVRRLEQFTDTVYLSQTFERHDDGSTRRFLNLRDAITCWEPSDSPVEWRTHFHVPVFLEDLGGFESGRLRHQRSAGEAPGQAVVRPRRDRDVHVGCAARRSEDRRHRRLRRRKLSWVLAELTRRSEQPAREPARWPPAPRRSSFARSL